MAVNCSQRKQVIAQNMNLTADEATKFWPVFDQYRKEAIKPNDDRWAPIKEYAANYKTMTDAQARDFMKRATAVDGKCQSKHTIDKFPQRVQVW